MKNWKRWLLAILLTLVIAFVYYYINLPGAEISIQQAFGVL